VRAGRIVAVWGPTGGPGRTTLAVGVAAEAAHRGVSVSLVDADPYGGTAGQHLAVLEEVSGLLAATRSANVGTLDPAALARVARQVVPGMRLLTGLPRPDRWREVRSQAFREVLSVARRLDELVVVDTGFGLPAPTVDVFGAAPDRDDMTLAAIEEADEVVVVAAADPVGLTRLARSLRDLLDLRPGGPSHVVVNRMRGTLGWTERDIRYLVGGVAPRATVTFLPDDRAAADRALVSGRPLVECGDSALRRAVAAVVDGLLVPATGRPARPSAHPAGTR
jgi:MinD-like ATPase involved in chromosome partitioning or flagellar assembly